MKDDCRCGGEGMYVCETTRKRRMGPDGPTIVEVWGMVFCKCMEGQSKLEYVRNMSMGRKKKRGSRG